MDTNEVRRGLVRWVELLAAGRRPREVTDDVRAARLHRVRRGWYFEGEAWRRLHAEARHLAHILAVSADAEGPVVFSHVSAAVLWGLPLHRISPQRVHVVVGPSDRHSAPDVFRHEGSLPDADVVEVDGFRFTSLARTVVDVARLTCPEVALSCADAALARVGGDPRDFDDAAVGDWLDRLQPRLAERGVRGIRQARDLMTVADGRATLPLESVTRLQLLRLGFPRPRLQTRVPAPVSGSFWLDLELPDANTFVECDGRTKYTDERMRAGRPLDEVLLREKEREDWIRGVTGRRVVRVASRDVTHPDALAARLAAFSIPLPRRAHRLLPTRPLASGV